MCQQWAGPDWYHVGFECASPSPYKSHGPTVAHSNPRPHLDRLAIWDAAMTPLLIHQLIPIHTNQCPYISRALSRWSHPCSLGNKVHLQALFYPTSWLISANFDTNSFCHVWFQQKSFLRSITCKSFNRSTLSENAIESRCKSLDISHWRKGSHQHKVASFSQDIDLKRHLMRHSNTKPFSCPVCKKCFVQRAQMKRHLQETCDKQAAAALRAQFQV